MELEKIEIRHVMEHYEAFVNGRFVVSGDTFNEVLKDLRKMGVCLMISRGDIYWWNCPVHNRPHLLNKTRPVLVVSNNTCNLNSGVITVAPLTTSVKKAYPTQVPVVINGGVSIILLDKVTSIPVEELGSKITYLKDWQMEQADKALRVQLGLEGHDAEYDECPFP